MDNNILGPSLCEIRGLFKDLMDKLCGVDSLKWLQAFKLFLRGEPVWAEEMIHVPLEWGLDMGEVAFDLIEDRIKAHEKGFGGGWRLPTERELSRALKVMKPKFVIGEHFWSSTKAPAYGYTIVYTYDGRGGLGHSCSGNTNQKNPRLRLCRSITIPE